MDWNSVFKKIFLFEFIEIYVQKSEEVINVMK